MITNKTITVFLVTPLLSAFLLCSQPSSCSAATPKIDFDIPDSIECREVTTPQFAKANPTEKVIEAKFRVSARIKAGEEKQIAWVLCELESPHKGFRVIAFLPNTSLENTTTDIEIQENANRATHVDGTASGDVSVGYASGQASIHGQFDSNQATVKRYKAIAPKSLVLASGKTNRGYGVFFKLKPSVQASLEGEKEFACLMIVPKKWRGDWARMSCSGTWNNKGMFGDSFEQCGVEVSNVGLYLEKDDEAKRLAKEFSHASEVCFQRVKEVGIEVVLPTFSESFKAGMENPLNLFWFAERTSAKEVQRRIDANESVKEASRNLGKASKAMVILSMGGGFDVYNSLAWVQATCPDDKYRDGKQAVVDAIHAYQLTGGKNWYVIDTLAAAHAESGDFPKAQEWAVKAVKMAPDENSRQACRSRLELYKQNKPYREEPKKVSTDK